MTEYSNARYYNYVDNEEQQKKCIVVIANGYEIYVPLDENDQNYVEMMELVSQGKLVIQNA